VKFTSIEYAVPIYSYNEDTCETEITYEQKLDTEATDIALSEYEPPIPMLPGITLPENMSTQNRWLLLNLLSVIEAIFIMEPMVMFLLACYNVLWEWMWMDSELEDDDSQHGLCQCSMPEAFDQSKKLRPTVEKIQRQQQNYNQLNIQAFGFWNGFSILSERDEFDEDLGKEKSKELALGTGDATGSQKKALRSNSVIKRSKSLKRQKTQHTHNSRLMRKRAATVAVGDHLRSNISQPGKSEGIIQHDLEALDTAGKDKATRQRVRFGNINSRPRSFEERQAEEEAEDDDYFAIPGAQQEHL